MFYFQPKIGLVIIIVMIFYHQNIVHKYSKLHWIFFMMMPFFCHYLHPRNIIIII